MEISKTIRDGFIGGVIVIAPLVITIVIINIVYSWIIGFLNPFLNIIVDRTGIIEEILAISLLFVFITLLGIILKKGIGRYFVDEFDEIMERIPIVRTIYSSSRQMSNALVGKKHKFKRVVLLEWPKEGIKTIGFVTSETPDSLNPGPVTLTDEKLYNVFIPMSPNPMGGFLAIIPESKIIHTDINVKKALQIVVTIGTSFEEKDDIKDALNEGFE